MRAHCRTGSFRCTGVKNTKPLPSARNSHTGEIVCVLARRKAYFKAGTQIKAALHRPRAEDGPPSTGSDTGRQSQGLRIRLPFRPPLRVHGSRHLPRRSAAEILPGHSSLDADRAGIVAAPRFLVSQAIGVVLHFASCPTSRGDYFETLPSLLLCR